MHPQYFFIALLTLPHLRVAHDVYSECLDVVEKIILRKCVHNDQYCLNGDYIRPNETRSKSRIVLRAALDCCQQGCDQRLVLLFGCCKPILRIFCEEHKDYFAQEGRECNYEQRKISPFEPDFFPID